MVREFTFQQKGTNILQLVSHATKFFEASKTSTHLGHEHMQLCFFISDGRFSDREGLRILIREAELRNIFLVFLILDNPNSKDSILNLKSVSYVNDKPKITFYIDSFDFPYYIVLKDISNLPNVLSDSLRQWFEAAAQQVL